MSDRQRWEKETYGEFVKRAPERDVPFASLSGIPVEPLYTPESLSDWSYADKLGFADIDTEALAEKGLRNRRSSPPISGLLRSTAR